MLDLNIAFDRFASIGTVMHYILVISDRICYIIFEDAYSLVDTSKLQQYARSRASAAIGVEDGGAGGHVTPLPRLK